MAHAALAALGTSIFSEMTALANAHGAVNLSQGFPDFEGPPDVVEAAIDALRAGHNQYGRSMGLPALVQAISDERFATQGLRYDPMSEIVATAGATEGIAAAMLGLLEPGDEVILLEPFYDGYPATLAMAGAIAKVATLRFPDFALPLEEIRSLITPRTRMIVVNTPHNPTGKVFTVDELDALAALCVQHDLIALTDEVYEHLTFDDATHVALATRPGMRERTVSLSSTGKTFSYTGWKVGWACGPSSLIAGVQRAHQFLTFCAATPLHAAMATALTRHGAAFRTTLRAEYQQRRDFLVGVLQDVGFRVSVPRGAYFCLADFRALSDEDDRAFARRLVQEAGVASIPPSAFYCRDVDEGRRLLRFAFCKRDETLQEAARRLTSWRARTKRLPTGPGGC